MTNTDPISRLTLAELDEGSRKLKTDLVHAITTDGHPQKWHAMGLAAYLIDRRTKPEAKEADYLNMTALEVTAVLAPNGDDEDQDEEDPDRPLG